MESDKPETRLDELREMLPPEAANALDELRQHARELAPEADSFEKFAEMLGFGAVCDRCGRGGLDDEDYTDCDVAPGEDGDDGPWDLLCHECLRQDAGQEGPSDVIH
jgi:hypothetical protein